MMRGKCLELGDVQKIGKPDLFRMALNFCLRHCAEREALPQSSEVF